MQPLRIGSCVVKPDGQWALLLAVMYAVGFLVGWLTRGTHGSGNWEAVTMSAAALGYLLSWIPARYAIDRWILKINDDAEAPDGDDDGAK